MKVKQIIFKEFIKDEEFSCKNYSTFTSCVAPKQNQHHDVLGVY